MSGATFAAFGRYGWQDGFLGFPTSDQVTVTGGSYQRFTGGVIYSSRTGGAHPVWGDVLAAYGRGGWQSGSLGFPTSDVTAARGGVYQRFSGGVAYWSGTTGGHFVSNRLLSRYGADGWQDGIHGYPATDEYLDRGVLRQDYQHGSLWAGTMPAGVYSHNVNWAGQPNGYFCGPTSGYMVASTVGAWRSAATGESLSINALASASYMNTVGYGYTSFQDRRFEYGMNRWLGSSIYHTEHLASYSRVKESILRSFQTGYPTVIDEQERRGGPHFNAHNNATYSHLMVVNGYDTRTDAVSLADPGQTLWPGSQRIFWYPSLSDFWTKYLSYEVYEGGLQKTGIFTS